MKRGTTEHTMILPPYLDTRGPAELEAFQRANEKQAARDAPPDTRGDVLEFKARREGQA